MQRQKAIKHILDNVGFDSLLTSVPDSVKSQIRYVATDKNGQRIAFFDKPKINADGGFWNASGPYYMAGTDPLAGDDWQRSLIAKPNPWTEYLPQVIVMLLIVAAVGSGLIEIAATIRAQIPISSL